jgi:hypothetical protein
MGGVSFDMERHRAAPTTQGPAGRPVGAAAVQPAANHDESNASFDREVEWNVRMRWKSCVWTSWAHGRFVGAMSKDAEARHELVRRLFYLVTIAAEDAAAMAVEGQSRKLLPDQARAFATSLQELVMRIEILSSTIPELIEDVGNGDETA